MKFRKKPVIVDAVKWDGTYEALRAINILGSRKIEQDGGALDIFTLEGVVRANLGDWVIRGVQGETYPCKPNIFAETYEVV